MGRERGPTHTPPSLSDEVPDLSGKRKVRVGEGWTPPDDLVAAPYSGDHPRATPCAGTRDRDALCLALSGYTVFRAPYHIR